jgi:hypothetical protein
MLDGTVSPRPRRTRWIPTTAPKPPARSVSRQPLTLYCVKTRVQARFEGLNPDLWSADGDSSIDPDPGKRVDRIYIETILGHPMWLWCLQTAPATPPDSGKAGSLEEAKASSRGGYSEVKGGWPHRAELRLCDLLGDRAAPCASRRLRGAWSRSAGRPRKRACDRGRNRVCFNMRDRYRCPPRRGRVSHK